MQSLAKFDQRIRGLSIHIDTVDPTKLIFVLSTQYDLKTGFYDRRHCFNLLECRGEVVNAGKTSWQVRTEVTSPVTKELLYTNVTSLVLVDSETRRPTPVPSELKGVLGNRKYPVEMVKRLEIPSKVYRTTYSVRRSDLDGYMHVNAGVYLRICHDAMCETGLAGSFRELDGDLGGFRIGKIRSVYINEANYGDTLDVLLWENEDNNKIINGMIQRKGTNVFQTSVEFCDPDSFTESKL